MSLRISDHQRSGRKDGGQISEFTRRALDGRQREDRERRKATGRLGVYRGYTFVRVYGHAKRSRTRTRTIGEAEGAGTYDCGYRLSQSDRSIGSALLQQAKAFPYRFPACLLPQSSSSSSSSSFSAFGLRREQRLPSGSSHCMMSSDFRAR